jgi:hypothetical protein
VCFLDTAIQLVGLFGGDPHAAQTTVLLGGIEPLALDCHPSRLQLFQVTVKPGRGNRFEARRGCRGAQLVYLVSKLDSLLEGVGGQVPQPSLRIE